MTKHIQIEPAGAGATEGCDARPPLIIRHIEAIPIALPLKKPMSMAGITIATADNLLVRIVAGDGSAGWGEAASAPTMTGDTQGGLVAAVRDHLAPLLIGQDAWQRPALAARLRAALIGNTGAHSAVEMALFDLCGRAAGLPLVDLIGKGVRRQVAPMWLLGNKTPEEDIAEASAKQREGFRFFKLKVGTKPLDQEITTAHTVREALGQNMPLCADANCGFSLDDARRFVESTCDARLLFLEQPLGAEDLEGLSTLTRTSPIAIGADEGIHSLADVDAHARCGVRGLSLKLIKLGGFAAALRAATACQRLGLAINVAAKIAESSIATAGAVHLACAVPNVDWGVSLTHFYLAEDVVKAPLPLGDGTVALPAGPGLGVDVDEAAVARLRAP